MYVCSHLPFPIECVCPVLDKQIILGKKCEIVKIGSEYSLFSQYLVSVECGIVHLQLMPCIFLIYF
jgi:hypothetical protein